MVLIWKFKNSAFLCVLRASAFLGVEVECSRLPPSLLKPEIKIRIRAAVGLGDVVAVEGREICERSPVRGGEAGIGLDAVVHRPDRPGDGVVGSVAYQG